MKKIITVAVLSSIALASFGNGKGQNGSSETMYRTAFDSAYQAAAGSFSAELAEKSLEIATEDHQKARAHFLMGWIFKTEGMYQKAVISYHNALKVYRTLDSLHRQADLLKNIGMIYQNVRQHRAAFFYFEKALHLYSAQNDRLMMADIYYNMGREYRFSDSSRTAIGYFDKALALYRESGERQEVAFVYNELGLCYRDGQDYDSARHYYMLALESTPYPKQALKEWNNLGELYSLKGDYKAALTYYNRCMEAMISRPADRRDIALVYQNIAGVYDSLQLPEAYAYYQKALENDLLSPLDPEYAEINGRLYELYAEKDPLQAIPYGHTLRAINQQQGLLLKALEQLNLQYQVIAAGHQLEKEKTEEEKRFREKINTIIALLSGFLLLFVGYLYWKSRRRNGQLDEALAWSRQELERKRIRDVEMVALIKASFKIMGEDL